MANAANAAVDASIHYSRLSLQNESNLPDSLTRRRIFNHALMFARYVGGSGCIRDSDGITAPLRSTCRVDSNQFRNAISGIWARILALAAAHSDGGSSFRRRG